MQHQEIIFSLETGNLFLVVGTEQTESDYQPKRNDVLQMTCIDGVWTYIQ